MPPEESSAPVAAAESATSAPEAPSGGGIKTAAEVIEKVLAPEKGKEPARRIEKLETKAVEKAAEGAPEPDADAGALEKARFHLKHGDIAKFIDAAVGDFKADGLAEGVREALARKLGVKSDQWERIRKHEQATKRQFQTRETELRGLVERLKTEYAPLHSAREAYKAGDFDKAFKEAFGEDSADFQRKVIGQRLGKNPEVEKMRAELEAERAERLAEKKRETDARAAHEQQQAQLEYMRDMQTELTGSPDAEVAAYAAQPEFIKRVFRVLQQNWQENGVQLPLMQVVEYVRDYQVSVAEARKWAPTATPGTAPASAVQASVLPAKSPVVKAPARALKQSQSAEASGQPRKLSSAEIREKYQREMEATAAAE